VRVEGLEVRGIKQTDEVGIDPMIDHYSLVPYNGVKDDGKTWPSGFFWHGTDLRKYRDCGQAGFSARGFTINRGDGRSVEI